MPYTSLTSTIEPEAEIFLKQQEQHDSHPYACNVPEGKDHPSTI
jgi:hypothetical protein